MARPILIRIEDVASIDNLGLAYWRAARGKRDRGDVMEWSRDVDRQLRRLADGLLAGSLSFRPAQSFTIRDPKPRRISAPSFEERVVHHALMRWIEPVLERALVADTFACRVGKGSLAAVRRAQCLLRRHAWYVQIDIRKYFDSVDHDVMLRLLSKRIRGGAVMELCRRFICSGESARGLPIGSLMSQHFANTYLSVADRRVAALSGVHGSVRYMDDMAWWCRDREAAHRSLAMMRQFLRDQLRLEIRDSPRIQRCVKGMTLCGFRVTRGALRLSLRRRRRYAKGRAAWEAAYVAGQVDHRALQAGYAAVLATTAHADAEAWRRAQHVRVPPTDA